MADLGEIYAATRKEVANLAASLPEADLQRPVPATPGWSIRDVVAHLTGVVVCSAAGDFPQEFFMAIGTEPGIRLVNEWTDRQVAESRDRSLQDLLDEWESTTEVIVPMISGEVPWPEGTMTFAGYAMVTDLAVHQQDIYGALGLVRDREAVAIKIGFSSYVAAVDLRLQASGGRGLRFVTEYKEAVAGSGEPSATVRASRFELFRALSGRRNPAQVRSYEWEGDPEPFLEFFYPYGVREEALVE